MITILLRMEVETLHAARFSSFKMPLFAQNSIVSQELSIIPVQMGQNQTIALPHEVKREIYEREIKDKYDVLFVLEDHEKCARMYKELGLTVLKVMQ